MAGVAGAAGGSLGGTVGNLEVNLSAVGIATDLRRVVKRHLLRSKISWGRAKASRVIGVYLGVQL